MPLGFLHSLVALLPELEQTKADDIVGIWQTGGTRPAKRKNSLLTTRSKELDRGFVKIAIELMPCEHHIYLHVHKITLQRVQ